jgi:uncharacterized protein (TIGR03437 family)
LLTLALTCAIGRAQDSLAVSDSSLTFLAVRGGDSPAARQVAVTSAVTERLDFSAEVTPVGSAGAAWLQISLRRGTTPARLQVSVDQSGLAKGEYAARITIGSGSRSIPIAVALSVNEAAPSVRVAPAALRFGQGLTAPDQLLWIGNAGGGALTYRVSVTRGSDWLSVSPGGGTTAANQPGLVHVAADLAKAGQTDFGVVRVEAGGESVDVPAIVLRGPGGPILGLNLTGLRFDTRQNQGNANNRNVLILNLGDGTLNWSARVLQGDWLTLATPSGRTMNTDLGRLGFNADPGTLPGGTYYALVQVSADGATNSPQYISAVLNVAPAADPPVPDPSPQGLFFVGDPLQAAPPNQPIRLFVSSTDPIPFQAAATTADGGDWLQVSPSSGVTSTNDTRTLQVSVKPATLQPGVHTGEVTVMFADRTIRTTSITLVAPANAGSGAQGKAASREAGCVPTRLSLTQTGLINSFASAAGWPNALIVRLADDCGAPVLNANVVTTFSSNDPPLPMQLTNSTVGLYSATWQPRGTGSVAVTTTASAPGLGTVRTQVIGAVRESRDVPVVYQNALLSSFDPQPGAPLAPGTPVEMFGSSLSSATDLAGSLPLPATLAQTSLLVGSARAPLYYVSPEQVNAQVPPELSPGAQYAVAILSGNRSAVADPVVLTAARPALLAKDGIALAEHGDASAVSNRAPAQAGEMIRLLATGLGATDPAVAGGAVPTTAVAGRVLMAPTVTIGGRTAAVRSAALAPDIVGVYRITVQVPTGLAPGGQMVEITQQGIASNRAVVSVGP